VSQTITHRQLRNESARVLRELQAGETFIITNHGVPVGELRPFARPERVVARDSLAGAIPRLAEATYQDMRREADALIDQDLEGDVER
jgi:antitoxin (DNA-binding transcriptional repressor) of toxin-antitoxin stability system